ncbi:hypothetical protein B0T45_13870 [Chromobacterium haemolyticum]|uniref:Uncharacterized protein n=1 Tax=Chromobacterium haemolyticum TaxID=394935 RepID=A0A1W0CSD1_9NEIS|nr:hypothetical protein B0T45_13870 [Chromobacterium haemolyticum]
MAESGQPMRVAAGLHDDGADRVVGEEINLRVASKLALNKMWPWILLGGGSIPMRGTIARKQPC